ncbi:SDR family oxidoreductase [Oscillatoria sp. FACHB-1407]|uniref:SDR family oxidoreductase n=1 Tax=Oscillatoria sp. FACHB-1407 TaxID=2692847 RepID=UPI001687A861|nr:SDR family oxidoreductase [Oscillatoria sp. FACHB-1407]MBD2459644.1 SDR family oxidoreductase [Oscillatoria sp. FACHB-1407]
MTDSSIFLAGASRGVGHEIARLLTQKPVKVKALLRSPDAQSTLEAMGISVVFGDAMNRAEVDQAMQAEPIWAVVSTIGGLPKDGQRSDYLGNKNLIDAAVQAGVQRFILVSSIGSGNSAVALPPQVLETLGPVLIEKAQAEQHLIESGLNYTIIRPGGLKSEPATGNAVLTPDPAIAGSIHRADVADLVCRCLFSNQADYKVLSAVDRQMTYGQTEFEVLDVIN